MLIEQTLTMLQSLKLTGMAAALAEQRGLPDLASLPFEDRLALLLEREQGTREDRRLTWLVFLQRFAYRQVMYWVVVRSFVAAVRGHVVGWGKLERTATVVRPA